MLAKQKQETGGGRFVSGPLVLTLTLMRYRVRLYARLHPPILLISHCVFCHVRFGEHANKACECPDEARGPYNAGSMKQLEEVS